MKKTSNKTSKIAKSASIVSIAVMCSRLLGLIREQIFAGLFGAGYDYDSFVVAFRIPNLLRDLFGEGALAAAFVTVFSSYDKKKSQKDTWQLASNTLVFFGLSISIITLIGIYFAAPLVSLLAPDFSETLGKFELTTKLTIIMMPFLVFVSLAAVVMGALNTKGHFFIPAIASSFFNLGSIIGGVSLAIILPKYNQPAIVGMAIGTLIGGFLQFAIQIPQLRKTGFLFIPNFSIQDPGLKKIIRLMIPATIGLSATQLNIFVNTNFASSCIQGSVSWLNYSFRLVQLPIGLFGVAFSIALMPVLARQATVNDINEMRKTFVSSLIMVFSLTIPASVGLIMLSEPIVKLIFEHGAFTNLDTIATAQALSLFALGLFAYSANKIIIPVFYALDNTRFPVIGSFLAVIINIIIVTYTIDNLGHKSIALSTSITMLLNCLFLSTILYFKLGGYSLLYIVNGLTKIIIAAITMGIVIFYCRDYTSLWIMGSKTQGVISVFGVIAVAALFYIVLLYTMKLNELMAIIKTFKNKLFN